MRIRKFKTFACDFETTVYKGQEYTEVWAAACVELNTDEVNIFHSIKEQFDYFLSLNCNVCGYYHNLKFDGSFWLSYLLIDLGFEQSYIDLTGDGTVFKWIDTKDMKNKTFKYSISEMGQWYYIIIKVNNHIIELRDSLKLLPFSLRKIGKSFNTKHQKLEMEYTGFRYAGCTISNEEKEYISNDVLVLKEALEIIFKEGHNKLTIGSCCLSEYKKIVGNKYDEMFPNLYNIKLDTNIHKYKTAGEWIRRSYKGGWCYLVKGKENKIFNNGITADVNSLYPSMMYSESGNRYPIGLPTFWAGNYIPNKALMPDKYYFVRVKTRFYIKKGFLPIVQIKGNLLYKSNQWLETSDYYDKVTNRYYEKYYNANGDLCNTRVELTLTMTDFELLKRHYELVDFEILDGCYFDSKIGIFDEYIERYKKIKLTTKGAKRELAKLFLNNLYGKMASSTDSSFKIVYVKDDKSLGFISVCEDSKQPGYIPVGSAITSYARNFTINAAQQNYYGIDKHGFIYADTDSIHCDLPSEEIKGIKVHDKNFCCWKLESCWDKAIFVRQKTYIEHVVAENLNLIEKPYYNLKCAGMPDRCKDLFIKSMDNKEIKKEEEFTEDEKQFLSTPRNITDFKIGLKVPSKLLPKRIRGGVLLVNTTYQMR